MNPVTYRKLKLENPNLLKEKNREKWGKQKERGTAGKGGNTTPPLRFIAIDGEGEDRDGTHIYTLLGSQDRCVYDPNGLGTVHCFEFLLSLKTPYERKAIVSFYFGYDVNMILRDLPDEQQAKLAAEEQVIWRASWDTEYYIRWIPSKSFTISRRKLVNGRYEKDKSVTVWDTQGFFQAGFARTLDNWDVGTAEEREFIRTMKRSRSSFASVNDDTIREYNALECRLLIELCNRLQETCREAGLTLGQWNGAGAVAAAMMKQERVKDHITPIPEPVEDAVKRAYFGGRIQMLRIGLFDGPIYIYDVCSAYPTVTAGLPSLKGDWYWIDEYDPNEQWAVWKCEWSVSKEGNAYWPLTPFPFRRKDGRIEYPVAGMGYYWSPLVAIAKRAWGDQINVVGGWVFKPDTQTKPFGWVPDYYARRARYKAEGKAAEKVLKLGLNSLYGKTAQSKGMYSKRIGKGKSEFRTPPYQSFVWAGLITATTQARLLGAAIQRPGGTILFATDGVYTTEPLELNIGKGLGDWEETIAEKLYIFQPGSYAYFCDKRKDKAKPYTFSDFRKGWTVRTRSFKRIELPFGKLRRIWERKGAQGQLKRNVIRFIGLKLAMHRKEPVWRKWLAIEKVYRLRGGTEEVQGHNILPRTEEGIPYEGYRLERNHIWEPTVLTAKEAGNLSWPFNPRRKPEELKEQELDEGNEMEQPTEDRFALD